MEPSLTRTFGLIALFILAALGVGCSSVGGAVAIRESAAGPWAPLPPGSTLTLNRPVQVPQDRARVFFREGRVVQVGANQGPSCGLEVRVMSRDGPQAIAPQTFRITRVEPLWTEVARLERPGPARFLLAQAADGGSIMIQEGYHLWLGGGETPNVMRLTCLGMFDLAWRARPITLAEMRAALGEVATLSLGGAQR